MRAIGSRRGDTVSLSEQDHITYLGRSDDMINAGGFRVSPLEVEGQALSFAGLRAAAAVEREVRRDVTVLALHYVGDQIDEAALEAHLATRLAPYKRPRMLIWRETPCPWPATARSTARRSDADLLRVRDTCQTDDKLIGRPHDQARHSFRPNLPVVLYRQKLAGSGPVASRAAPFTIEWHPFQLNPDMPGTGMDRASYLENKFGGKDAAAEVYGGIADAAQAAGLTIDFSTIERTPNTLDAHRLIHWAGIERRQLDVVDALCHLFRAGP